MARLVKDMKDHEENINDATANLGQKNTESKIGEGIWPRAKLEKGERNTWNGEVNARSLD